MSRSYSPKLLAFCLFIPLLCFSQLDTASILGTVLDSSGSVIPNATIVVENQSTAARFDLTTNAEGNFIAPVLPIGTYRITASAQGFRSQVLENNPLRVSDRLRVEITLQPGAVGEKITVTSDAPLVEALREIEYTGYVSGEVLPWPDPIAAARQTVASYRTLFGLK